MISQFLAVLALLAACAVIASLHLMREDYINRKRKLSKLKEMQTND